MSSGANQLERLVLSYRNSVGHLLEFAVATEEADPAWAERFLDTFARDAEIVEQAIEAAQGGRFLLSVRQWATDSAHLLDSAPNVQETLRFEARKSVEKVAKQRLELSQALGVNRLREDDPAFGGLDQWLRTNKNLKVPPLRPPGYVRFLDRQSRRDTEEVPDHLLRSPKRRESKPPYQKDVGIILDELAPRHAGTATETDE